MATQITLLSNGLGGVGSSYASVQDLDNISLPRGGSQATIDSSSFPTDFNLSGLTLRFQITHDGIVNIPVTFTFPANYSSLDQVVAAFSLPGLIASNNSGRFRLQTVSYGYSQGILLFHNGTANQRLFFDFLEDTDARGIDSLTKEFTDDEKVYQLVVASSEADGYIRRRYPNGLVQWDYKLIEVVCDIAAFRLLFRDGYSPGDKSYDRNYEKAYQIAINWLSDVGNRKIHPNWVACHKPVPTAGNTTDPRGWFISMGLYNRGC